MANKICMLYNLMEAAVRQRDLARPGERMRSRLLDGAARRFKALGLNGVSIGEIATEAGAYPSQVTYYFGTKEALFVEAACREFLHLASDAEAKSVAAKPGRDYVETMVRNVVGAPELCLFVEALALARRRLELQPQVQATFDRIDRESTRAFAEYQVRSGEAARNSAAPAHRFWVLALGLTARGGATGESAEELGVEMLRLLGVGPAD
jgi:AcrR family transcriptional regulator